MPPAAPWIQRTGDPNTGTLELGAGALPHLNVPSRTKEGLIHLNLQMHFYCLFMASPWCDPGNSWWPLRSSGGNQWPQ